MKRNQGIKGVYKYILLLYIFTASGCGFILQPVEQDKRLGKEYSQQVETEVGIYYNKRLTPYVKSIGKKLAQNNPDQNFNYTFTVIDQIEPNAFALPGGYIYISRGLLALTNSEEELAGIIGHEIIHVSSRHAARGLAKARGPALLTLPGRVVGLVSNNLGNLINAPIDAFGGAYLATHGRKGEYESDQLGQRLAASAGYDPVELAYILYRLEKTVDLFMGEKGRPSFFDTHPTTPNRVKRIKTDAQKLIWTKKPGFTSNTNEHLGKLDGMLLGENPAGGIIVKGKFLHPELDLSIDFPKKWHTTNKRDAFVATSPNKDAILTLGIVSNGDDPKLEADLYKIEIKDELGIQPVHSKQISIGKLPAYLLSYNIESSKNPVFMHVLWIAYRGLIYQFTGIAPDKYKEKLKAIALSFSPITNNERKLIKERRLRVVSAKNNESLYNLSKRFNSIWDPQEIAVVNGLAENTPLKKGQLVKVAIELSYYRE